MRSILLVSVLLLSLVSSAHAALMAANANFPDSTAPNDIRWELRTADNQFVRLDYTFRTEDSLYSWGTSMQVYKDEASIPNGHNISTRHSTAAIMGIDWQAWQAAILNPAFNRWVVTRNGVTIEKPWTRTVLGDGSMNGITELRIAIGKQAMGRGDVDVTTVALYQPVPEPATWLMLLGMVVARPRRR